MNDARKIRFMPSAALPTSVRLRAVALGIYQRHGRRSAPEQGARTRA
jgi:hypothetical protein